MSTHLDGIVARDRRRVRLYLGYAFILILPGILVLLAVAYSSAGVLPTTEQGVIGLGGFLLSALSGLPLKEYLTHQGRIEMSLSFKKQLESLTDISNEDRKDLDRINDLIWQAFGKSMTG